MQPILFHLPFLNIPIYGYGMMLFCAFIGCNWLARRLCTREGIDPNIIPDLAIWLFIAGISGGRIVYVVQYWHTDLGTGFDQRPFVDVLKLWDGGLVLYGALFGGVFGYFMYHRFTLSKRGISAWKMFDIIAPCVALGIAFGRIGCLFTGCCYGNVACETCPAIHFPYASPAMGKMVERGYQTPLGFLYDERDFTVEAVEPGTAAAGADLRPGDVIVEVNGKEPHAMKAIAPADGVLNLKVTRDGKAGTLPAFEPRSIGVNPTQIYETISMCLVLFFLLSYHPYKRRDGEMAVLLLITYSIHRFLNEMLRTDTEPVAFGLTLSQNVSIGIFALGVVLGTIVLRRPLIGATPVPASPAIEAPKA